MKLPEDRSFCRNSHPGQPVRSMFRFISENCQVHKKRAKTQQYFIISKKMILIFRHFFVELSLCIGFQVLRREYVIERSNKHLMIHFQGLGLKSTASGTILASSCLCLEIRISIAVYRFSFYSGPSFLSQSNSWKVSLCLRMPQNT